MTSKDTKIQSRGTLIAREMKQEAKAESFFLFFSLMGPTRSLEKLHYHATATGLKISLGQLKRYSSKYKWVERLAEDAVAVNEKMAEVRVESANARNGRQAQLGAALQGLGARGVQLLAGRVDQMSFNDAGTLIERGQRIERLATGEATHRHELTVQIVEPLIRQLVALFEQVNEMDNRDDRAREFSTGADSIIISNFKDMEDG
jgi:hypothetical protein